MVDFLFSQSFAPPLNKSTPLKRRKDAGLHRSCVIPVTLMHPPARKSSLVGQHLQAALGAAAALAAISLSPGSAQALVVNVGG